MSYLLTFVRDQSAMYDGTEDEMRQAMEAWNEFDREAIEAGVMLACAPLEHPSEGKTVRISDGGHAVTDGPFAETKEQLGGFCLLAVDTVEEALEWADKVPMRPGSAIEVRKVKDLSPWGYELKIPVPIRLHDRVAPGGAPSHQSP